ncbi:MAG: hypothetical protein LBT09_09575 [Planctomycetaceae bacterium]|jgi:tetratricopeptide (TPR) repeat protein|nr:hypothetical protein [Planctomycetaceae bacterium]
MSIKNLFKPFSNEQSPKFANSHAEKNNPANSLQPLSKTRMLWLHLFEQIFNNDYCCRIIFVTIIFATLLISGCKSIKSTGTDSDYRGQTPNSIFANESAPVASTTNPLAKTTTSTAATPAAATSAIPAPPSNQDQKPIPSTSKPDFVNVPFADPFGTSSPVLPAQNSPPNSSLNSPPNSSLNSSPNSPLSPTILSGNQPPVRPPNNLNYADKKTAITSHSNPDPNIRYKNSPAAPVAVPQPFPLNNTQNVVPPDNSGNSEIWGDQNARTQSLNDAAKKENENYEKNRLLEIAKAKRMQDVDPKKKYLQPLSDRLGPFADREKREVIDNEIIISPVTYLEENPKIYDNKPIYDWEKEERAAFDWSTLDPVNFYTKIINQLGFGVNEEKAKQQMQDGRAILLKVKQKSDEIAAQKLSDSLTAEKLPKKAQAEQEKLYREAGKKFRKAAKHLPDSLLEEDALNLAGESFFFGNDYTRAFNSYQALMVKYKHSKYLDNAARRLFAIARYWEAVDQKSKITLVNFTEKSLPAFDTFGYAVKSYETIFINDPNNPLADDAVMAIAAAHLSRGKYKGDTSYERAAFYYKYLTENYPLSKHFDAARKGELIARSEAYMGAEYNDKTLDAAQELAEMINRSRTPNTTTDDENNAITELNENIVTKNAEREWVVGQYYDAKRYYGSAKLFYQKIIEKYPQTTYAEKARKRLEQIKNKPDKPSNFSFFQRSNAK